LAEKNHHIIALSYFCNVEKFYQHIENLLAKHDYVVVPNLGGFTIQMQSARILSDRITPPRATVCFNVLMSQADGLLAIEVSRSEQISYRKAVEYIDEKVEKIKNQLNSSGSVVIGNVGILQKSDFGSLTFNPVYKSNFLPQNLGLSELYITKKLNDTLNEDRKITITFPFSRVSKYAIASMLLAGLFLVSPHISDLRKIDYASLASLPLIHSTEDADVQVNPAKLISEDTTGFIKKSTPVKAKVNVIKHEKAIEDNNVKAASPAKVTKIVTSDSGNNYHVIIASLPSETSADKLCKDLIRDKFIHAHVVSGATKTYRVAIQSFPTQEKAFGFMQNLRKADPRFETAWVYSK
jgi:nucleoid DNA-binding protein